MIITTTNGIEGKRVVEYKGIVCGEVISGVDFIKDFAAGLTRRERRVYGVLRVFRNFCS